MIQRSDGGIFVNNNNNTINELMKKASSYLNTTPDKLEQGRVEDFLSPEQAMKVRKVLADENAIKKLLSSKQAQQLIKGLNKNE